MIDTFYKGFHQTVETTMETSERATGERHLGEEPATGKPVIVRIGRFGPMVQIGSADDEEKPRFASLRTGQRMEQITLEEALELFKLPRNLGEYEEKEMVVNIGRFGPYIRHNNIFVSLKKEDDPMTITADRGIELIEAKRKAEREKVIKTFPENPEVQVLNGRWGPYIAIGKENFKIPKEKNPAELTLEECIAISKEPSKGKGRFAKKTAFKKATAKKAPQKKAAAKKRKS